MFYTFYCSVIHSVLSRCCRSLYLAQFSVRCHQFQAINIRSQSLGHVALRRELYFAWHCNCIMAWWLQPKRLNVWEIHPYACYKCVCVCVIYHNRMFLSIYWMGDFYSSIVRDEHLNGKSSHKKNHIDSNWNELSIVKSFMATPIKINAFTSYRNKIEAIKWTILSWTF